MAKKAKAMLDPRVDMFVEGAADFAKPILRHMRGLVHGACGEVEETIKWQRPFFLYRGKIVCAMMAFKAHCGFHIWGSEMREVLRAAGYSGEASSGVLGRIMQVEDLPEDRVLRGWLQQAFALAAEEKPEKVRASVAKRSRTEKTLSISAPDDLAAELARRAGAIESFESLSPSCRKEYVEWIEEAKRAETRARRVSTAAEWISEGKRRNWKYEGC